jgi:hypothetical protein
MAQGVVFTKLPIIILRFWDLNYKRVTLKVMIVVAIRHRGLY